MQILSPPYNGNIVLNAGPAQFGIDLGKSGMGVSAEVVLADPIKGCTELKNHDLADHRIVIMERGDCMFVDKVGSMHPDKLAMTVQSWISITCCLSYISDH